MLLDKYIQELRDSWGLSAEALQEIRERMIAYAVASQLDSRIATETQEASIILGGIKNVQR